MFPTNASTRIYIQDSILGVPLVEPQDMVGVEGLVVGVAIAGVGARVALVDSFGLMSAGVSISRCCWSKGWL